MSFVNTRIMTIDFTPANRAQTETKALFAVKKGDRVLWAALRIVTRSQAGVATSTYEVGDGTDPDGFIVAANTDQVAGTLVGGSGALLASSGGKLYTADDTVDLVYTANTGGNANPTCKVKIALLREWAT